MTKKKKERKIPEVLVFTDINNYQDDLASFVVLAYLADKKLISLRGIIAELGEFEIRRRRAMYAKGVMAQLGYPFLRAAPGGDYEILNPEIENNYPENAFSKLFEASGVGILRSGTTFVQEYFKSVKDRKVIILLNAPFPDFAKYMKATGDIVYKKVKKIIVMGNALKDNGGAGEFHPDPKCFNFKIGYPAAESLFAYAQAKGVRLVAVPAQSVKEAKLDYGFLQAVAESKNPVALQLLEASGLRLEHISETAEKENIGLPTTPSEETCQNPASFQYDMISTLALSDGIFKAAGGIFEKEEGTDSPVEIAKIADPALLHEKICEIFKEKLLPRKITLEQLIRPKPETGQEPKDEK